MQCKTIFKLKVIGVAIAGLGSSFAVWAEEAADAVTTQKIEVISTTPLEGIGLPVEQVPANIQRVDGEEMREQQSLTIADYMNQNMVGVNINETQNNPFQPNVNFRGFTASPLLGTPQGLSIFYDGVRINEPFGDVVSWDLIPMNAIDSMTLVPGSNPVFGLNTLGGAISMQTKSGRTHQGGAIEALAGSWDRRALSGEYGGVLDNGVDYFFAANTFDENGWRDSSPSEVHQLFGKVGWQNETTDINLSITAADNDLIGNGLVQKEFLDAQDWESINTKPDQTENKMIFVNLNGSHWLNDMTMFSGNVYYRDARTKTLNGDVNDDIDPDAGTFNLADCVPGADEDDAEVSCSGALNRSKSDRDSYGFTAQLTFANDLFGRANQLVTGVGYDHGRTRFSQSTEFGTINAGRGVDGIGVDSDDAEVRLRGVSKTWSLYATDTLSLTEIVHLTLSGRYNHTKVENRDGLVAPPDPESLTADHSFNRFNPAIGLSVTPTQNFSFYGSYNEGSRAPTAIELGCANPDVPCKLPNAMAGDPPLDLVVSKTWETGARGKLSQSMGWSASLYRTQNTDDIQFIAANSQGAGYFDNVGKTRRVGLDLGLDGAVGKFRWFAGYSYIKATYESDFALVSEVNSSAVDTDGDGEEDTIFVGSGDEIPGIPNHQFKFRGEFQATPQWMIGTNIIAFSDQYAHGNENNNHEGEGGKISGYTVVNLDTRYKFANSGWQVFAKVNNVFDREYYSGGLLGESFFTPDGTFDGGDDHFQPLYAPGAPRAGWIGVRYEFGGKKPGSSL